MQKHDRKMIKRKPFSFNKIKKSMVQFNKGQKAEMFNIARTLGSNGHNVQYRFRNCLARMFDILLVNFGSNC